MVRFWVLAFGTLLTTQLQAIDGIMLSAGAGMDDSLIQYNSTEDLEQYALGLDWESSVNFEHDIFGYGELSTETYFAHLPGDTSLDLLAIRPRLTFWESPLKQRRWFWEFGIGLAYLSETELANTTLSTHGQFATLFGIGWVLDKAAHHRLSLRYNHYSNGYLKRPNPGMDTLSVDWLISW